ncbi:MAG: AMP-dependent synthetase [Verrucomicrobiaceae bacterium]|nr:MAG: AMP-dependent synthetase [Verrucomicrobiaceae bacterium]
MNLVSRLAERARLHPDRPALVDRRHGTDRVITYRELTSRVGAGAHELEETGLRRGQVVLVFQPVSIELYEFLLAAFHAGLRVMLADPSAGRAFLTNCCHRLQPDAFFGSWKAQCLRLAVSGMRSIPVAFCSEAWFPGAKSWHPGSEDSPVADVPDEEPALITFTSGSTGVPKAAVRTHGFLLAQHGVLSKSLDFRDGEVDLITLPVFVLANLASGLTSVLAATDLAKPGTPDVPAIASQCARFHVTRCAASPAFFEGLLAGGIPPFEKVYTGGAPVFPDLLRRLSTALPNAVIDSVYGSTEAEPIAHFPAHEASRETDTLTRQGGGLCSGIPVPEIELRIIADRWGSPLTADNVTPLSIGEAGEIIVRGDHVLRGYLGGLGDSETKIPDGDTVWHRTGDAGWLDSQGRVWLLGRCAEKLPPHPAPGEIPADAFRYPFAIECALRELFPAIRMAAMERENRRTLVVGKNSDPEEAASIRASAAAFGIHHIIHLATLPLDRRHNAKIDYPALRQLLENEKPRTG